MKMRNPYRMALPAWSWKNMTAAALLFSLLVDFDLRAYVAQEVAAGACSAYQGWVECVLARFGCLVVIWTMLACVWPLVIYVARLGRVPELADSEPGWTAGQMLKAWFTAIYRVIEKYSREMDQGNLKYAGGTAALLAFVYGMSIVPIFAYIAIAALSVGVLYFVLMVMKSLYQLCH